MTRFGEARRAATASSLSIAGSGSGSCSAARPSRRSEVIQITGASEATARRDLAVLEAEGLLSRTRGGARAARRRTSLEEEFEIRQSRDRREKRLIGQRRPSCSRRYDVFVTDGTSAYALAQCLVHRRLTMITSA